MNKYSATSLLCAAAVGVAMMALPVDTEAQNRSPRQDSAAAAHRAVKYPRVGHQTRTLPAGHQTIRVNRQAYRYHNGSYYRPGSTGAYVVVRAPIGARVRTLPRGYVSFFIGPQHYFYVNSTYYLRNQQSSEYIVVEEPDGAVAATVSASESSSGEIFVYPKEGQTNERRDRDRYECYVWAVEQTGFDPGTNNPEFTKASDYRRAISACLEGRGYTVK